MFVYAEKEKKDIQSYDINFFQFHLILQKYSRSDNYIENISANNKLDSTGSSSNNNNNNNLLKRNAGNWKKNFGKIW